MNHRFLSTACAVFFLATFSFADIHYVSTTGGNAFPFTSWGTAATSIQSAISASTNGDVVLVTNGTYNTGGVAVFGTMTNRIAITNGIAVKSVNGAALTTIVGQGPVGSTAIRCAWIASNAVLDGFTLSSGCTLAEGDSTKEVNGGGAWCEYNGTISNCVITACAAENAGGGFYLGRIVNTVVSNNTALFGGGGEGSTIDLIDHCTIVGNHSVRDGGGLYSGNNVRNSHFAGNTAGERGGASYGTWNIESCTIVGNSAQEGGGVHSVSVSNSVVYYNTDQFGEPNYSDSYIIYSCTTPDPEDTGNITNAPGLAGLWNPHLVTNSPCINAGTNSSWMGTAFDVDGETRLAGTVDMGCDEVYTTGMIASLFVTIGMDCTNAVVGTPIRFSVEIRNRTKHFTWSFGDGQGATNDTVIDHSYAAAGDYIVTVQAWNLFGVVTVTRGVHIVNGFTNYVSRAGSDTPPYDTWAKAASNIQAAVNICAKGGTVLVSNGLYALGGVALFSSNRVAITNAMTVRSVNGPTQTFIRGVASTGLDAMRGAYVAKGGRLEGFSVFDGRSRGSSVPIQNISETLGGGVYAEDGSMIVNCMITNNGALNGGGSCGWGTFVNCTLADNSSAFSGGGALYGHFRNCSIGPDNESHFGAGLSQAEADMCDIHDNRASETGGGSQDSTIRRSIIQNNTASGSAGGSYVDTLENCLILFNTATTGDGGGTHQSIVRNCTIRGNSANSGEGGGAYWGTINSSIIWQNYAFTNNNVVLGSLDYSCTTPNPGGTGNITNDPQFVNDFIGNYSLVSNSPCIDKGDPASTVTNDYDGVRRPLNGGTGTNRVDMGAYEFQTNAARVIGLSGNLAFGNVPAGQTATATLTITNSGNAVLTVNNISYPSGFSGAWSGTVPISGSHDITVTFAPVALTTYGGTVTVSSDKTSGGNTISASGTGTVVITKIIGLSTNLPFGNVITGRTTTATLTITNSGNTTLTISSISYPIGFSGAWSGTIAAGRTTNVTVTFAPTAIQSYGGTITVNSDKTAGGNTLACSGAGVTRMPSGGGQDYSGDGPADLAIFDPASGAWYVQGVSGTVIAWAIQWGWSTAKPVPGDYNGDGVADLAVFDTQGGYWYIKTVSGALITWANQWGWSTAKPVPGDYDGDRTWDQAVFDTQGGNWYIKRVSGPLIAWANQWGWSTAKPVPGDYDGDGTWDQAVFDTQGGNWYIKRVSGALITWANQWGWSTAKPVAGDYDGDGVFDQAVFDTQGGNWYIKRVSGALITWANQWGWSTAKPVSGDFDGDGKYDLAVFDTATGKWFIKSVDGRVIAWNTSWGWKGALAPALGD